MRENREVPPSSRSADHRVGRPGNAVGGKPGMHGAREVGSSRSTCEPAEQGRGRGRRRRGRKGGEPRGTRPAKLPPDAVPDQGRPVRWTVYGR